ncbi:MAG: hypothetical protein CVU62_05715 [Deltaproteobacteria bacterium HGW-Deltaproteobacteria-2]|nr:MAG: hypothetical protein CVU62_05715 [Deltaproteobacteria bacterium HGW-Deltaproteobacteria-2]
MRESILNKSTFSIVIPAYNGERFLHCAIASALAQTRKADELIIVDDDSTDGTAEIAKSYGEKIKYYFNDKATGFVDAWNRAISKATGDYITIIHQDDLLHPEYIERVEKALLQFPNIGHFFTACNYIDDSGLIIKEPPRPHSLVPVLYSGRDYAHHYLMGVVSNNHIHRCPGVTTSRELLLNKCTYRKEAGLLADDDFFYRVGSFTEVAGVSFPLASFRLHAESETAKTNLTEKLATDYIFQTLQSKGSECIFDESDKKLIYGAAVKYINEFLFYRLLNNDHRGILKAIENANELENIVQGNMKQNLPLWAKLMWLLAEKSNLGISHGYVFCLDTIKKMRSDFTKR